MSKISKVKLNKGTSLCDQLVTKPHREELLTVNRIYTKDDNNKNLQKYVYSKQTTTTSSTVCSNDIVDSGVVILKLLYLQYMHDKAYEKQRCTEAVWAQEKEDTEIRNGMK